MRHTLSCHPEAIGLYGVAPNGATWLQGYNHLLTQIFDKVNLFKDLHKYVNQPLEYFCMHGHKKATIGLKLGF